MQPVRAPSVVGMVAILLLGGCTRNEGTASRLRGALHDATSPTRYAFEYRSGGTRVNSCFLPNRSFTGMVDHETGVLALAQEGTDEPSAYVAAGDIHLRATLFAAGVSEAPWLRAKGPLDDQRRAAMVRSVGDGFAGYVASGLLPPDGRETALELLDVADAVRVLEQTEDRARYELRLPPEALGIAADEAEVGDVIVDVTISASRVTRISVDEAVEAADAEHAETDDSLWSVEYRPSERRVELPEVGGVEDLSGIDPARLQAPTITRCEVPL